MNEWRMDVRMRCGALWERLHGSAEELREQGEAITTAHGQKRWWCVLFRNGESVAMCKAGKWRAL